MISGLSGLALSCEARNLLVDFVELYQAITLRNTVVYHTEKSLQKCLQLYTEWMLSYAQFMIINMRDPMREKWATPKMHDILHIILKIPERGTTDYHSCNAWVLMCPQLDVNYS